MACGPPWKQTLFIAVLYVFSFATFYWIFYELEFVIDIVVQSIILLASLGLSFFIYNLIFKTSKNIYTDEMKKGRVEAKAYGNEEIFPPGSISEVFKEIEGDEEPIPKQSKFH